MLCVYGHHVFNVFQVVEVLVSLQLLSKCASDTVISILQRGTKAEDMGDGFIPGRSDRLLFDYISSCLILLIVRADCII